MPLHLEKYNGNEWVTLATLTPDSEIGSLTHTTKERTREVILFRCNSDGLSSQVLRSKKGCDFLQSDRSLMVINSQGYDLLSELRDGDLFEFNIQPDNHDEISRIRFRHTTTIQL